MMFNRGSQRMTLDLKIMAAGTYYICTYMLCLVVQSHPTLCDPMDYSLPGTSVHGDSPGKDTRVGCHALLQGIVPTQGLNPGLQHCRRILYHLSYQGSPVYMYVCLFVLGYLKY